jgi:hypothetical protein
MKKLLIAAAVVAMVSGLVARADTYTLTGSLGEKYALDYTNAGGGVYDIFLTIDTTAVTSPTVALGDVAFKVNSNDDNLTFISAPAGYTLADGGLNAGGCSIHGGGFFCFTGSAPVGGAGDIYTFEASITDVPDSSGSIKDQFLDANGGVTEQLSKDTDIGTHTAVTPEPSSLALLGTGALGFAGVLRRKFRRS